MESENYSDSDITDQPDGHHEVSAGAIVRCINCNCIYKTINPYRGKKPRCLKCGLYSGSNNEEIMCNPQRFFTETDGWPGGCSGNLLAWVLYQTRAIYPAVDNKIKYVETVRHGSFVFDPNDFNFLFNAENGEIREIEYIKRFFMTDGSHYVVQKCDGEYHQTHLEYHAPIPKNIYLQTGLKDILKGKRGY